MINGPNIPVPAQFCSLQHHSLLSPPDTSTTGHHFHFGSASSFFLGLFLCSSLNTYQPGRLVFQCHVFLPFHTVHGVLKARILKWTMFRQAWLVGTHPSVAARTHRTSWHTGCPTACPLECVNLLWPLGIGQHAAQGPGQRPCWSCQLEPVNVGGCPEARSGVFAGISTGCPGTNLPPRSCGVWRAPWPYHCLWLP